jgi:tetratricopeptide (TPR) repeat protein
MAPTFRDLFKRKAAKPQASSQAARCSSPLNRASNHAEGYYKRANAKYRLGRWEAALVDYGQAIALNPGCANAYCNRGTVLERLQRWGEALASYDRSPLSRTSKWRCSRASSASTLPWPSTPNCWVEFGARSKKIGARPRCSTRHYSQNTLKWPT